MDRKRIRKRGRENRIRERRKGQKNKNLIQGGNLKTERKERKERYAD